MFAYLANKFPDSNGNETQLLCSEELVTELHHVLLNLKEPCSFKIILILYSISVN
jgi:hypothetical protein